MALAENVLALFQPPPAEENDAATLDGARKLASRINAYWEARGYVVNARPRYVPFHKAMRGAFYVVDSNLVDGLPPEQRP